MDFTNLTTTEIDNLKTVAEKELLSTENDRDTIETEINLFRRQIDELRIKIRDKDNALIKAKCLVREKKAEVEELTRAFWRVKDNR